MVCPVRRVACVLARSPSHISHGQKKEQNQTAAEEKKIKWKASHADQSIGSPRSI